MMTSQELEQVTFLFLKQLYDIVEATNAPIYQINLTKVANSVGLKTVPSQDVLYSNFPTSYPTLEDAIKICNAMRTIKQKAKTVTQKEVDALVKQRDDLQSEITTLTNLRSNLKKDIEDYKAKLEEAKKKGENHDVLQHTIKEQRNELEALYNAISSLSTASVQIKNKYTNI